jgi:ABC-type lipoprotein export system ATPase subunit
MNETNIFKLDDVNLAELRLAETGFVFWFLNLLPRLRVLRNVELPLTIAGKPDKETPERAKEMLKERALSYGLTCILSNLIQLQQQHNMIFQNPERQSIAITPVFRLSER